MMTTTTQTAAAETAQYLVDAGMAADAARETADAAYGATTTVRECQAVIAALETIKDRTGLSEAEADMLAAAKATKKSLADAAFAARTPKTRPTSQRWDDDAPGGVVYE